MSKLADAPLPARAALRDDTLYVALADIPASELQDAFLQDTLRRMPSELTLAKVLIVDGDGQSSASGPAGLIFHVARCGSTLASQLLKHQPGLTVYSEPPAINEVLAPPHVAPRARIVGALRSLGEFFSRHAGGPYVLKLSSWNVLFCDLLTEAFPQSPWALCLRDPLEVCVSLHDKPPGWLQAGAASPLQEHLCASQSVLDSGAGQPVAHAFAAFCAAAERLEPARGSLVFYETMPEAVWEDLLPAFGMRALDRTVQRMLAASQNHAKSRLDEAVPFEQDAERKRLAAGPELRASVDTIARPALAKLVARMKRV